MIALLLAFAAQLPTPEARLHQGAPKVDPAPYLQVMVNKFFDCMSAEGVQLPTAQAAVLEASVRQVAGLVARGREAGDCTDSRGALQDCIREVNGMSCEALHRGVKDGLEGMLGRHPPPPWAVRYSAALGGKIASCYREEIKRAPTAAEAQDLDDFARYLAFGFGALQGLCTVKPAELEVCISVVEQMGCGELAGLMASSPPAVVQAMMGACGGFLRCDYDF